MLKTTPLVLLLSLLALMSTGCTNINSTVTVINQKITPPAPAKTFAFKATPASTPEREKYLKEVERHLATIGWRRLPDGSEAADYSVLFIYRQLKNEQHIVNISKEADYKDTPLGDANPSAPAQVRRASTEAGNMEISSYIYFAMALDVIDPKSSAENKSIWTASVMAQSPTEESSRVYPTMIDSLFKSFPGKEGYKYVVTRSARSLE